MDKKISNKLSSIVFYLSILIFIIGFNFAHNPPSGWYQQFLPNLGGRPVADIAFIDSLRGYAVTGPIGLTDTAQILKTTNSGDNWQIIYKEGRTSFKRVIFINTTTGYAGGNSLNVSGVLIKKTTNGGENWFNLNAPTLIFKDIHILNEDTMWIAGSSIGTFIYRTTNGGSSWQQQLSIIGGDFEKAYFYNSRIGFVCTNFLLFKTTNSGFNWSVIPNENRFADMYFIDSLVGWKTRGDTVKFSSNGGLNWFTQTIPSGGIISQFGGLIKFSNVNRDTIWGAGGFLSYPNNRNRAILYRTTNQGLNWYYQIPDTNFGIPQLLFIKFINKNTGWSYTSFYSQQTSNIVSEGIHTTVGGDTTFTNIKYFSNKIRSTFSLEQNYPNPFNPITKITYYLHKSSDIKLLIFDITGKRIREISEQHQQAGSYEYTFDGTGLSSGVYFYRLVVGSKDGKENFVSTRSMILIK